MQIKYQIRGEQAIRMQGPLIALGGGRVIYFDWMWSPTLSILVIRPWCCSSRLRHPSVVVIHLWTLIMEFHPSKIIQQCFSFIHKWFSFIWGHPLEIFIHLGSSTSASHSFLVIHQIFIHLGSSSTNTHSFKIIHQIYSSNYLNSSTNNPNSS